MAEMSTKINDLPDSHGLPAEVQENINMIQNSLQQNNVKYEQVEPVFSNATVSKNVSEGGLWNKIKSFLSEENIILILILFVAALPFLDQYIKYYVSNTSNVNLIVPAIKAFALFSLYFLYKYSI